jgi:hypothetical protein
MRAAATWRRAETGSMAKGICTEVYLVDGKGDRKSAASTRAAAGATTLYFGIDTTVSDHPQEQLDLKRAIEVVLQAIDTLYLKEDRRATSERFGEYLQSLKLIAHLGLVGSNALPAVANHALVGVIASLMDEEAPGVKDRRLRQLASSAALLCAPFLAAYAGLRIADERGALRDVGRTLSIDPQALSSFAILWVGCFIGVVLAYGIRKSTMTLPDLVRADDDRLLPITRLVFAGTLTMLIGILLLMGVLEIKLGSFSTGNLASYPMASFLVGAFCGISELSLPAAVADRAGKLFKTS